MPTHFAKSFLLLTWASFLLLSACNTSKGIFGSSRPNKLEKLVLRSEIFQRGFTGFYVREAASGKVLAKVNENKYFTPASNTKILTLYTSLCLLPDTLPRYRYKWKGDTTLILRSTADPTLLHPRFAAWGNITLPAYKKLWWDVSNWQEKPHGPGWMWDDFGQKFSPQRSAMPIKGNLFQNVPMTNPDSFLLKTVLLGAIPTTLPPTGGVWTTVRQTPLDTVLQVMMYDSDNLLAEQLLLMCSDALSDTLQSQIAIQHIQDSVFAAMPQPPVWRDGSGVTRYNAISPIFFVELLQHMHRQTPENRLFSLFPAGGVSGTIRNRYQGQGGKPYLFAKTGSMSGVVTLCGYLRAKSGKVLIFSFLHNNIYGETASYHLEMQKIMEYLRDNY